MADIHDVDVHRLKDNNDERGFFREIIRVTDDFFPEGFAQWSHSRMKKHVVKAWHFHHRQVDWWYIPVGKAEVVLYDLREESATYRAKMTFLLGEGEPPAVVRIPPGVAHGCQALLDDTHLFYITSRTYDPDDEGRYPFDWPGIAQPWRDPVITVDTRTFMPPHARVSMRSA
ncbi:MAG: dTDP-4-dehydrorhamnose 3,5-epimerase family protein [Acidobacteriota bacterium]